jgi:capsular exopolysaccharide synthesis family protein
MELVAYFRLFRKWFWLLLIGAFLAGGAAFLRASRQPDLYQASVTVSVGSAIQTPNPQYNELLTGAELAQTYAVLAKSYDVLEAAVKAGNFPITPGELDNILSTHVINQTSLLVLTVTYTDPGLTADMVNEVAQQLILNSPTNLSPEQQQQIDLANGEIEKLNQELAQARLQLSALDSQIGTTTDQTDLNQLQERRNTIVSQINQASQNIAIFSSTISSLQQRTNVLTIVERARIPSSPLGTNVFSQTILGTIVGFALAAGLVLLIEDLDDTVATPSEATQLLGVPALGAITRFGKSRDSYPQRLITYRDPGSHISEEYRTLRTNLLFSTNGNSGKGAYIITSPGPSEGKSITAANLAVTMAMAGWRVLLVDADLRRPKIHEIFNLENNLGLSTLLSFNPGDTAADGNSDDERLYVRSLRECVQETEIPGLQVIPSGHIPLNPTEVLGSASMQRWFQEFRAQDDIDIVLFDTPPSLVVADTAVLASAVDVPVIVVLESKKTRRGAAVTVKEQFAQLDVKITGAVLNAVSPRDRAGYGYGYNYYYYYYYSDSDVKPGSQN